MKKLLLTALMAAGFGMAAMAQEGDTTRTESNEYRRDQVDSTEMRDDVNRDRILNESDSLSQDAERESTNYQQDAREMRDSVQQDAEQASDELGNNAREMRDSVEQDAERMGDDIESDAEATRDSVEQDAEQLGNYLRQGAQETKQNAQQGADSLKEDAEQAGQSMQQGVRDAGNNIRQGNDQSLDTRQAEEDNTRTSAQDQENRDSVSSDMSSTSTMNNNSGNMSGSSNNASVGTPAEVDVVEGKEGPNNEVVYSFNGELWYVDRESKQMVKADESKLKDSKHKVMVHEGTESSGKRTQKGEGKKKS